MGARITCPECGETFDAMQRRADCPMCGHRVGVVTYDSNRRQFGEIIPPLIRTWLFRIVAVLLGLFVAGMIAAGVLYVAGVR